MSGGIMQRPASLVAGRGPAPSRLQRGARIALLTEGCYPYVTGGVSTWCGQLISGLAEHTFDVVAITGQADEEPRMELPANVGELRPVPLWGWIPPARRIARRHRTRFLEDVGDFLEAVADSTAPQEQFDAALYLMSDYARQADLSAALRSAEVADALGSAWSSCRSQPLSTLELLAALELLEHSLRPLSAPPIHADLCHAVSNGLPSLLALVSKWAYGTPFVMSEHGVYLRERYLAFRAMRCPWPVKAIMLGFFRRLTQTAYAHADVIAPVNVYNQRWQVGHGAHPDRIVTAFNGVDAGQYPVAQSEPEGPTVSWVGRIDPLKDLVTLVEGFALVRRRVPAARLRLFGPTPRGNEAYEREVREAVGRLGLGGAVSFEGPVSPVSRAYHAGHVVALTSISEGLPYTIIEAMMCARATVSTDVGGCSEVVGDAGLLVPARDPARLADALVRVLADDGLRADLAVRGRERALTYFRVDQMLTTFRGIYAVALGQEPDVRSFDREIEPVPA